MDKQFANKKQLNGYAQKCADKIDRKYGHGLMDVVLLGVLNGALPFLVDVSLRICETPIMIDTIKCQSYTGMFQRDNVKITKKPDLDLNNKIIIIVEDIVDSGETIDAIRKFLYKKYSNIKIEVCTLFKRSSYDLYVEYLGRVVPEGLWLYGYGMDNYQRDRNLPRVMIKTVN